MRHSRSTRRVKRTGGDKSTQHSLSQLKRFVLRAKEGKDFKILQFGYNLGRLQEMIDPKIPGAQKYWWSPIETLVEEKKWDRLLEKIDEFQKRVGDEFDMDTVNKL